MRKGRRLRSPMAGASVGARNSVGGVGSGVDGGVGGGVCEVGGGFGGGVDDDGVDLALIRSVIKPSCPLDIVATTHTTTSTTASTSPSSSPEKANGILPRVNGFRSKGEALTCALAEKIFGKPFIRVRPDFLQNPETGKNLELDCYNDELKIALEYNGITHYVFPNYTGQSKDDFIKQVRRDDFKRRACDMQGVYLISIPYNVPHNMIEAYIRHYSPSEVMRRQEQHQDGSQDLEHTPGQS